MDSHRRGRIESAIHQELTTLIPRVVKDPRVVPITITSVKLTADASQATVMLVLFGQLSETATDSYAKEIKDCLEGLNSAAGFLRKELAPALSIRHTPQIVFKEDKGLANTLRVDELLKQLEADRKRTE